MVGRRVLGWVVVMVMMMLACCGLPVAQAEECAELKWLAEQRQKAVALSARASHLEHGTAEQIRDLQQLSRRLAADLQAVERIAKQVECIEAELRASKCHPAMCNHLEAALRKAIEQEEQLIKRTLKAIHEADELIKHTLQAAYQQLKRLEAVECDIKTLLSVIARWESSERKEAEKRESAAHERAEEKQEAEWRKEILALIHRIECALDDIQREYTVIEKAIQHITQLLHAIDELLKALRHGLAAILDLLHRYHNCLDESKELEWLEKQRKTALALQVRAAHLEHGTAEQIRDLQQLSRRLAADLQAVERIAKQVECIEAELRASKCHPAMCNHLEAALRKAIEQEEQLIKRTLKAIHEADELIKHTLQAAYQQLKRLEAVECDIKTLLSVIARWESSERKEAEKRESAAHERAEEKQEAEWRKEILALIHRIECALDDIQREYTVIEKAIQHITQLLHAIDTLVRELLAGLGCIEKALEELRCCWKAHP